MKTEKISRVSSIVESIVENSDFNSLSLEEKGNIIKKYIKPKNGRLLVLRDAFSYHGRLIVPDSAKVPSTTGRVIAAADDLFESPGEPSPRMNGVKIGDRIIFGVYSGNEIKFRNQTWPSLRSINPDEVIAILLREGDFIDQ
jgi:co-chaperonin GroES (HSP10)